MISLHNCCVVLDWQNNTLLIMLLCKHAARAQFDTKFVHNKLCLLQYDS